MSAASATESSIATQGVDLHPLLGLSPSSTLLSRALSSLATAAGLDTTPAPQVKAYPDSVYYIYHPLGLSLVYHPTTSSYRPKTGTPLEGLDLQKLKLAQIDIYNHGARLEDPKSASGLKPPRPSALNPTYSPFPSFPILLRLPVVHSHESSATVRASPHFPLRPTTQGADLVSKLGEPDRKGGGEGSMGVWTEWTSDGVLVEWASGGLQAWEKGAGAVWRCTSVFERGVVAGKLEGEAEETEL